MSFNTIKPLLDRFKNITPPNDFIRGVTSDVIKKKTGILIKKENIYVRDNMLYIQAKPLIKNEIFLYREKIIEELVEKLGDKSPNGLS